jgi:protein SCO1/2
MTRFARHLLPAFAIVASIAPLARAQYNLPEVKAVNGVTEPYQAGEVGVDEKLGSIVSGSTMFVDESGTKVPLSNFLGHDRPVILWLGYYECPMLCDKMSGGMVTAVRGIQLDAGKEFSILNVSIDPNESAALARAKKATYLKELGQPGNAAAWNLLTGSPDSIKMLADSVGYKFKKVVLNSADGAETQYAHPAVLVVLSPEGKVTRYLYPLAAAGIAFDPRTMQLSLIEASEGRIGTVVDRVVLTCLRYDAHTGKYTWIAVRLMQWAGALTILIMAAILVPLWIRSARTKSTNDELPPGGRSVPV